jgi:acylaminoacyl-peptidase
MGPGREVRAPGRRDHSPEWSPDGTRIAFLGREGASDQLFVVPAEGGEARQASAIREGVLRARWSPDGRSLALLARVVGNPAAVVDDPRPAEGKDQLRRPPVARIVRSLEYKRDGAGYFDGRHAHLFVVPAEDGGADGESPAAARQLTDGPWSVEGFSWAPDGRALAVIGDAEPDADLRRTSSLYRLDLNDDGWRQLADGLEMAEPAWSPRGDLIAFLAPVGDGAGHHQRVWVVPATGGPPRCLTTDFDRSAAGSVATDMRGIEGARLIWSEAGDRLLFLASGRGAVELYSVDLDGQVRPELVGPRRALLDFDARAGRVAAVVTDATTTADVVVADDDRETAITDANPWLRDCFRAEPERLLFRARDGLQLEGWLLKPPDFSPERTYPLVMEIHGGPHSQYGWAFFHEMQMLAGAGCLVFYMNPRGSDGYGEEFRHACVRDWGGLDYEDLMSALDQLIERTGYVDVSRMGVGGGSYGGFMTNWIVGHTDRFAAAVSMRSISNLVSEFAQHDIVLWGELEMGPRPWPDADELWERSPIRYVNNIRTPLLLLHSEMDLRCAISQAEELFGALRLQGKEVEMVRFPGESHDLSRSGRPDRRVERLLRIGAWFERYLSPAGRTSSIDESVRPTEVASR